MTSLERIKRAIHLQGVDHMAQGISMAAVLLALMAGCGDHKQGVPEQRQAEAAAEPEVAQRPPIPIRFTLDKPGVVTLVIDDSDGNRVRNLISETPFEAGEHVVQWDGLDDHKPVQVHAQPVFRFEGDPMQPGRYVVRGIVHDPVRLRYEMPFYTSGNPPWDTRDGRGAWLTDFGPALAVASLPGETPMMLIGSGVGEGFGIVWTDLDGQRLAGLRGLSAGGGWSGGELLAQDGGLEADAAVTAYVGNNGDAFEIEAMTQRPPVGAYNNGVRSMSMCLWGAGRKVYRGAPGQKLGGIAARDMTVVAAISNHDKLVVIQDASQHNFGLRHGDPTVPDQYAGTLASEVPLKSPRGLAVTADGRQLLAISGQHLVRFPFPPRGEPTVLVAEGLQNPQQVTLDQDGNIYVSDQGSHQVKVFTPDGKPLRSIGEPGGPQLGPYNELRMANPQGIAISEDGKLWVAEASEFPRRISVWERDGTFIKALYGNANYGGGGMVDAGDHTRAYVTQGGGTLQLRLDGEKGASTVEKILWLPDERWSLPGVAYHIAYARVMGHAVYHDGRRYLSNAYSTAAGGGNHSDNTITVWRMDDRELPVLAASLGSATMWSLLKQPEFAGCWPEGLDPKSDFALYAWSDLDGNGQVDPAEVRILAKPEWKRLGNPNTFSLSEDLAIVDCLGSRYRPVRFTEAGAPVYDLDTRDNIFPGARPTGTSGGGQVLDGGDGWAVATWSPESMPLGYVAGAKDGVVRWRYPARATGNHAGYAVGVPDKPGELVAISSLAGRPFTPRGTQERLWSMVGLKGNVYVLTTDGMFVATLFKDWRQGKPGPTNAVRGVLLNDMSLGDDAWATTLTQSSDGGVYIVGGHDSTWITRVEGLESIRRLPERVVTIAEETAYWLEDYQDGGCRQRLSVKKVAGMTTSVTNVPVLVKLTSERFDFAKSTPAGSDIRFTSDDGTTLLDFERVRHDAKAGEALYWVRVSLVWAHGVNFYVYSRPTPNTDLSAAAKMWPAANCRAVLHMDETSGATLYDSTANARNVGLVSRTLGTTGQIGLGSGGTASAGDLPGTAMLAGSFTYSAWIKPAAYNTQIAYQDTPGQSQTYTLSLDANGKVKTWNHTGAAVVTLTGATTVPSNQWTHVAHVMSGGTQTVYVNGVQDASGGGGSVWFGNGGTRMIPIRGFNGIVDEVRLVNGASSGSQIMMEYLSERDGLLRYGEREGFRAE